jgi:hypothetical protein
MRLPMKFGAGRRLRARDQFGQVHVTRRVEEVHAAETLMQMFAKNVGQTIDTQAGSVAREHCVFGYVRGDLGIEVALPVEPFGDRLDDQVAAPEQFQVAAVVGRHDRAGASLVR